MFVGTSCQIVGLKRFLRKEYDNLLAVDFICHGVPSPGIWRKYLEEIKSSQSEAAGKNSVLKSGIFSENIFMRGFLANLYLRPSCYNCTAKNGASNSDLTIADFWGIQNYYPEFDDDKGVSVIFVHTDIGKRIIEKLSSNIETIVTNLFEATASNLSYLQAVPIPTKYSFFWKTYSKTKLVHVSVEKSMRRTVAERIIEKFRLYLGKYYRSYFKK